MADNEWLPLQTYSTKYNVSLSTLRRRIKAETIPFKLEHGKYYILDELESLSHPGKISVSKERHSVTDFQSQVTPREPGPMAETPSLTSSSFVEASVLTSANRLVEEIKAAYAKILQEKEEQIGILKEQVVDLKMLVKVLEAGAEEKRQQAPAPAVASNEEIPSEDFFFNDFQSRDI